MGASVRTTLLKSAWPEFPRANVARNVIENIKGGEEGRGREGKGEAADLFNDIPRLRILDFSRDFVLVL